MGYKLMFILTAIVALAFGVGYLVAPQSVLGFFGTDARVAEQFIARFFGSALLTLGLVLWFAKDITDDSIQRNFGYALLAGNVVGLILTIWASTANVIRSNSWISILVYVLLALGYAFLLFLKPRMKE